MQSLIPTAVPHPPPCADPMRPMDGDCRINAGERIESKNLHLCYRPVGKHLSIAANAGLA
jgi:hypothetical protein